MNDLRANPHIHDRQRGITFLLCTMVLWSFPTLAIEFLTEYMDLYTQSLVRFTAASVFLWTVCLVRSRKELLAGAWVLLRALPAVLAVFGYQYLVVRALYMKNVLPGLTFMVVRATVLFTAVMSCIFFADERSVMRDRRFIIGALLCLAGLAGFVVIGAGSGAPVDPASGVALIWGVLTILASAFCWSLYTILIKLLVRKGSPLVTYTYICTLMTIAFAALTYFKGEPLDKIPGGMRGAWVWIVAVGSGALCVGVGHVCYYYGIRILGTTVCATALLANMFFTPLLSHFIFGERFGWLHVVAGALLIVGSFFTIRARPRTHNKANKVRGTL